MSAGIRCMCMGTLQASGQGGPVWACVHRPGACIHGDLKQKCVHGPSVSMHAWLGVCLCGDPTSEQAWGPSVCMYGDQVGVGTWSKQVCMGLVCACMYTLWGCACGDPVGTDTGMQGSGKDDDDDIGHQKNSKLLYCHFLCFLCLIWLELKKYRKYCLFLLASYPTLSNIKQISWNKW